MKKLLVPFIAICLVPLALLSALVYVLAWCSSLAGYAAECAYEVFLAVLSWLIDTMEVFVDNITGRTRL